MSVFDQHVRGPGSGRPGHRPGPDLGYFVESPAATLARTVLGATGDPGGDRPPVRVRAGRRVLAIAVTVLVLGVLSVVPFTSLPGAVGRAVAGLWGHEDGLPDSVAQMTRSDPDVDIEPTTLVESAIARGDAGRTRSATYVSAGGRVVSVVLRDSEVDSIAVLAASGVVTATTVIEGSTCGGDGKGTRTCLRTGPDRTVAVSGRVPTILAAAVVAEVWASP